MSLCSKGALAMHGTLQPQLSQPSLRHSRILALDLGKFNSVLCNYDPATAGHAFVSLATDRQTICDRLAEAAGSSDRASILVVFETCEISGWVYDLVREMGFKVAVANPSNEAWRWTKVKRKTDRDDALKLAKMAAMNELPTVHMPSPQQRQKRRLVHHRRSLVQRRTMSKNQIRSIFGQQGIALPRGTKCWTKAGVQQIQTEAKKITNCEVDDLWRGRLDVELKLLAMIDHQIKNIDKSLEALADEKVKLLMTVPGVGIGLAQTVVVHLDDPHRFSSVAQVGSYAGLVPRQTQSGEMNRHGHITRRGPSLLRGMLVEVAWMVYRHNAWAKAFVDRVSRGIKARRKIAIVALARKLLVRLWAMLRDNKPWQDPSPVVPMVAAMA
jgi:transposase